MDVGREINFNNSRSIQLFLIYPLATKIGCWLPLCIYQFGAVSLMDTHWHMELTLCC